MLESERFRIQGEWEVYDGGARLIGGSFKFSGEQIQLYRNEDGTAYWVTVAGSPARFHQKMNGRNISGSATTIEFDFENGNVWFVGGGQVEDESRKYVGGHAWHNIGSPRLSRIMWAPVAK